MKYLLSFTFTLVLSTIFNAQQVIPMSKSKDAFKKYTFRHTILKYESISKKEKKITETKEQISKLEAKTLYYNTKHPNDEKPFLPFKKKYIDYRKTKRNQSISLLNLKLTELETEYTEILTENIPIHKTTNGSQSSLEEKALEARDSLNVIDENVFIYGFGSTDAVSQGNIAANGGFSFGANVHPWDRFFLSIGLGGTVTKKEKPDSVNINSIFFPDNANSVINAHYEISTRSIFHLLKYRKTAPSIHDNFSDDFLIYGQGAMQSRNIENTDSTISNFGVYNLGIGVIYRWTKNSNSRNRFSFDIGVGYGYIEIAKQSKSDFESLVNPDMNTNTKFPMIYRGVNVLASVQYNDLVIYARIFGEVSTGGIVTPYENKVYFSTGIKVTGVFFSF